MAKLSTENPLATSELLIPVNQLKTYDQTAESFESTPALLDWLGDLTNGSYDAWLTRGKTTASVE